MISSVVVALLAGSSAVFAAPSVSVSFAGEKVVTDVDNFKVVAKVSNTGSETLTLLNDPNSLLTPHWSTKTFSIASAEGAVPEFKGVAVRSPFATHRRAFVCLLSNLNIGQVVRQVRCQEQVIHHPRARPDARLRAHTRWRVQLHGRRREHLRSRPHS